MHAEILRGAVALSALLVVPVMLAAQGQSGGAPASRARQMLVVATHGWDAVDGVLQRYERPAVGGAWRPVGEEIPVVVGRSGLAWGRGLHDEVREAEGEPVKREGDGKAPAGVFRIGSAFGYPPAEEVPWIRLPYIHSTESFRCVDDVESAHYNRVVDSAAVQKDWTGKVERMRRDDHQYRLGAVVEHNWGVRTRPGDGSCIFLHIWNGPGEGTAGCTAMEESAMREVLRWLDPARGPVLVQLPRSAYEMRREAWRLP